MKIGLYLKWPRNSSSAMGRNVIGDELYADSMKRALSRIGGVESVDLYYPDALPTERLDVLVHLNDTLPDSTLARTHVLYLQNGYNEGSDKKLAELKKREYDGYAFISHRLMELHQADNGEGIFLPFGVDTSVFYPRDFEKKYAHQVAYVGNDIKGAGRSERFLVPATKFNLGLYGNWGLDWRSRLGQYEFWKKEAIVPRHRLILSRHALGKIPQDKVPCLYSSSMININCTLQDCVDWDVITLRTYEVLACGGFLITDKVPVAERTMQGCMVFTDGGDDLTEKIKHYLAHDEERKRIAQTGHDYTMKNATIDTRAGDLYRYLTELA